MQPDSDTGNSIHMHTDDTYIYTYIHTQDWGNMVLVVWCTEHLVDWIKHAFVTKFNKIDPEVRLLVPHEPLIFGSMYTNLSFSLNALILVEARLSRVVFLSSLNHINTSHHAIRRSNISVLYAC